MRCPKCGHEEDRVIDSRSSKDGASIRRRRECAHCGSRFTTYEEIERELIRVIKRDGRRELFDRRKLIGGMMKACEKRPISVEQVERAVEEIEASLEALGREIPAKEVGAKVMEKLHVLDPVAYVRYASVYRQFQDLGEFIEEIRDMEQRTPRTPQQPELFV